MLDNSIRDRALGAIVGAAVGDALGASYEFLTASEIASQGDITTVSYTHLTLPTILLV